MRLAAVVAVAGCAGAADPAREQVVITTLAEDNYECALREPELVAMKLRLMQEAPFIWMRGTARVFWRDLTARGHRAHRHRRSRVVARAAGRRSAPREPRHVPRVRRHDGRRLGRLRRLRLRPVPGRPSPARRGHDRRHEQPRHRARRGAGLCRTDRRPRGGQAGRCGGEGAEPYLDKLLAKAQKKGDADATLDELAPMTNGARQFAFGDIDPVDASGVIQKRLAPVSAEQAAWIDAAVAQWSPADHVVQRARRLGAGVASYPLYRFYALLDGDALIELKEERDGIVITGVPQLASAEWTSPARRVVDAQHRLNARPDEDDLLGGADLGGLSLRIHAETAYQKGVAADDLAGLAADQQVALARRFGAMLARAHGQALTADGVPGWTVIAPFTGGSFASDTAALAQADATQILSDYAAFQGRDLAALVLPLVKD